MILEKVRRFVYNLVAPTSLIQLLLGSYRLTMRLEHLHSKCLLIEAKTVLTSKTHSNRTTINGLTIMLHRVLRQGLPKSEVGNVFVKQWGKIK